MGDVRRRSGHNGNATRLVAIIGSWMWLASTSRVITGLLSSSSTSCTRTRSTPLGHPLGLGLGQHGGGLALVNNRQHHMHVVWMPHTRSNQISTRSEWQLSAKKKKGDDSNNDNDNNEEEEEEGVVQKYLGELQKKMMQVVPPRVWEVVVMVLDKLKSWIPMATVGAVSFVVGGILSVVVLLYPIYNSETAQSLTEPVTLFETILSDLDRNYVDPVDTNKLFETGISAMLRSLDPYTEFEGKSEAVELSESVNGKYGGVGLVISGSTLPNNSKYYNSNSNNKKTIETSPPTGVLDKNNNEINKNTQMETDESVPVTNNVAPVVPSDETSNKVSPTSVSETLDDEDDFEDGEDDLDALDMEERSRKRVAAKKAVARAREQGIRVVTAFEGYAFDYGMRVGDKLLSVDGVELTEEGATVESVRNLLRGDPGTFVKVSFVRDGVDGIQTVQIPRTIVSIRDVKLATLLGKAQDGIVYIQLTGFTQDAGLEMRNAIFGLQIAAEQASPDGTGSLQGLILDLRGNPGGLLTSAVDVASLLVPKGSDIVSAKGRGFPNVLYRSRVEPILNPTTKLAVLINGNTASAAEIVSGAVQDLDVGLIVGSDRTFGKGLVQNVEDLPFNTALKFTVAKYYTPSGRCIQSTNYKEGGGLNAQDEGFTARKVRDTDKSVFYTKNGREVKDGGGVEADFKVTAPKASALEVTLVRSGIITDFAAEWSKKHQLTPNFDVDDQTYREFQAFVAQKQADGDIKLEGLYSGPMDQLKKSLKRSGYQGSMKEVDQLQASIVREMQSDFNKYKKDIKQDISQTILARYLPESMLLNIGVKRDEQVQAVMKLLKNDKEFNTLLARDSIRDKVGGMDQTANSFTTASAVLNVKGGKEGVWLQQKW